MPHVLALLRLLRPETGLLSLVLVSCGPAVEPRAPAPPVCPPQPPEIGRVRVTAKPISKERSLLSVASTTPNAAILLRLDGQARSPLPYQEEVFMGRHHVEIGGDGIKQASRWINVSQDARTDELLVESLTGKIQFETTPDDAIIQIRGKQANRGSSCHVLPEGRYLVEVHREGYKPYQLYFNVVADQNRIIRITLKK